MIESYLTHCKAAGMSPVTVSDWGEILRRVERETAPLHELDGAALAGWLSRPGWSAQTRATYYTAVKGYYRWACDPVRDNPLPKDPTLGLRRPKVAPAVPRPISEDDLQYVLAALPQRYVVYCLLAAYAGLRVAEIVGLHREQVTAESITIVRGKGGYPAVLPTHPRIWQAVKDLPAGPLCHIGRPANLSRAASWMFDHVGKPDITMHRLRHRYATALLRAGTNIRVTQELMRHRSLTSTQIYTQVTDTERRTAIGLL